MTASATTPSIDAHEHSVLDVRGGGDPLSPSRIHRGERDPTKRDHAPDTDAWDRQHDADSDRVLHATLAVGDDGVVVPVSERPVRVTRTALSTYGNAGLRRDEMHVLSRIQAGDLLLRAGLLISVIGCGGARASDAGPIDAGLPDASSHDAGTDAGVDASADAGGWDGVDLPPVTWELPDCVTDFGVLERIIDDGGDSRLSLNDLAVGGGTILVQHGFRQLSYLHGGVATPLVPPEGYESIFPLTSAVRGEEIRALAYVRPVGGKEGVAYVSISPGSPPVVLSAAFGTSVVEFSAYRPSVLRASDSEIDAEGNWRFLGAPAGEPGLYSMVVDRDLHVMRSTVIVDADAWYDLPLEHARSDSGGMLAFHDLWTESGITLIPYDETGGRPEVHLHEPMLADGWDTYGYDFDIAADGDVVVVQYDVSHRHGTIAERYAEVSLATGALVRGPEPFGEDGLPFHDIELSSAPGGGIDVVQNAAPIHVNPDVLANGSNPLLVYLGAPRPLRLHEREPLRVGAGAMPGRFFVRRDGDRLVIVWRESGPTHGERTAEGIYWAVLECDP